MTQNLSNLHYAYSHMVRHWHAGSEQFAGGDALFTALEEGWEIDETVRCQEHWMSSAQCVMVFLCKLTRGDETMTMPVITNPYVECMLSDMSAKLVTSNEKKTVKKVR
jgi:hypothetical protein